MPRDMHLEGDEQLGVVPFLVGAVLEVLGQPRQAHIVPAMFPDIQGKIFILQLASHNSGEICTWMQLVNHFGERGGGGML